MFEAIGQVSQTAAAIAAAVEEQGSATREIARNVHEAATGTQDVTRNIAEVDDAAKQAGDGARAVLSAASHVTRETQTLNGEVDAFLAGVRAA